MDQLPLDAIDRRILNLLQENGRLTNADLAERVGLSPPPTLRRVRKLEQEGYIRKYVALLDPYKIGRGTLAFVFVSLREHTLEAIAQLRQAVEHMPEVLECYHIAGQTDFLLKVAVRDIAEYEDFVLHKLTPAAPIRQIETRFVLRALKQETKLPLSEDPPLKSKR
ncbi:MAG: Lrp/AsnC family transcriptional regulator [Bacteroidetes bacterium]|nr:Lrp/AsnC family transcriptional regulator [Rhodothermia bacterium]MCS7155397.1 Lrp/AsnC family transcriptional regulator [Bacteroidota bacterium]MCX7907510.1 Lrp/AsnC family transcriptional regulator [Bacteroidota bacterium]MDW8138504.1 Lrp/AsnC family transcriptional regulator [Bacteroidota bacterium]MDW8284559.1 Lrp/AsnC family transcriptional regulator [Bacteroidota bacterium]